MGKVVLQRRTRSGKIDVLGVKFTDTPPWALTCINLAPRIVSHFKSDDLFDCLLQLRHENEQQGAQIICAGARLDVYPSRMSREMGGGRKAYVLTPGQHARADDLVDIFGEAGENTVGSVEAQKAWFEAWLRSLQ